MQNISYNLEAQAQVAGVSLFLHRPEVAGRRSQVQGASF